MIFADAASDVKLTANTAANDVRIQSVAAGYTGPQADRIARSVAQAINQGTNPQDAANATAAQIAQEIAQAAPPVPPTPVYSPSPIVPAPFDFQSYYADPNMFYADGTPSLPNIPEIRPLQQGLSAAIMHAAKDSAQVGDLYNQELQNAARIWAAGYSIPDAVAYLAQLYLALPAGPLAASAPAVGIDPRTGNLTTTEFLSEPVRFIFAANNTWQPDPNQSRVLRDPYTGRTVGYTSDPARDVSPASPPILTSMKAPPSKVVEKPRVCTVPGVTYGKSATDPGTNVYWPERKMFVDWREGTARGPASALPVCTAEEGPPRTQLPGIKAPLVEDFSTLTDYQTALAVFEAATTAKPPTTAKTAEIEAVVTPQIAVGQPSKLPFILGAVAVGAFFFLRK